MQSFCALARIDISGFAARVDEQYARSRSDFKQPPLNRKNGDFKQPPLNRKKKKNEEEEEEEEAFDEIDPGAEVKRFLNEAYFCRIEELARAFGGTVVNFAGDAACCMFRNRRAKSADHVLQSERDEDDEGASSVALKNARKFADEVLGGGWLFQATMENEFFQDVSVRIAVASGNVVEACVGGFHGKFECIIFGEACENLAKEARLAKPRKVSSHRGEMTAIVISPDSSSRVNREHARMKNRLMYRQNDMFNHFLLRNARITFQRRRMRFHNKNWTSNRDETVAIVFAHISLRQFNDDDYCDDDDDDDNGYNDETKKEEESSKSRSSHNSTSSLERDIQAFSRIVEQTQMFCTRHDGSFLQLGADEGDSLAIVCAFRTKFTKDSTLAKAVCAKNALKYARCLSRVRDWDHFLSTSAHIGVAIGNCCLGIVGDPNADRFEYLATGQAVNRAARLAKGSIVLSRPSRTPTRSENTSSRSTKKRETAATASARIDQEIIKSIYNHERDQNSSSPVDFLRSIDVSIKGGDRVQAFTFS